MTRPRTTRNALLGLAVSALIFAALPVGQAHDPHTSSNCSGAACELGDEASKMSLRVCGQRLSVSTHDGRPLNQGGSGCSSSDFMTINNNGNVLEYLNVDSKIKTYRDPSGEYILQDMVVQEDGGNVHMRTNFTKVNNGTLVVYTVHNHGATPWNWGFKYSYDSQVASNNAPYVFVHNRPGDGTGLQVPGEGGVYGPPDEDDFGPTSDDIFYVKTWEQTNGPDGEEDAKLYLWWHPDWGGTPPHHLNYINSGQAYSQSDSFLYQTGTTTVSSDGEVQWLYGVPNLIPLAPDDGEDDSGDDEARFVMWIANGIPDPLINYNVVSYFLNRPQTETSSSAVVDAGETAEFPIFVQSKVGRAGNAAGDKTLTTRFGVEVLPFDVPDAWEYELVDEKGQPVTELELDTNEAVKLFLRVHTPEDAFGNEQAEIGFRAEILDRPKGAYNANDSQFEVALDTATIVRPNYGIRLGSDPSIPDVAPGETVTFTTPVTNIGNIKDHMPIEMSYASGVGIGWDEQVSPQTFTLGRGETQDVTWKLKVPENAFGGERTIIGRAEVTGQNVQNQTSMKLNILSSAAMRIVPDRDEIPLTPGQAETVGASLINVGQEALSVDFRGRADNAESGHAGDCDADEWCIVLNEGDLSAAIAPQESRRIEIAITAPDDALAGSQQNLALQVLEKGSTNVIDQAMVHAMVERHSAFHATLGSGSATQAADPGQFMEYFLQITNRGNSRENISVEMAQLPPKWSYVAAPDRFDLDVDETQVVRIGIRSSPDSPAGQNDLVVNFRNGDQRSVATVPLQARVNQIFDGHIDTETPTVRLLPTDEAHIQFEVWNDGNGPDSFRLAGIPTAWDVTVEPEVTSVLQPGERALVWLNGTVRNELGTFTASIEPLSMTLGSPPADADDFRLTMIVSRPDLFVKGVDIARHANFEGDIETIVAEVQNLGGIEAKDVTVELFVNDEPTGTRQHFDRLAPGVTLTASLPWAKTPGKHTYKVVIDPDNVHDEGDSEDNNVFLLKPEREIHDEIRFFGDQGRLSQSLETPASPLPAVMAAVALAAMVAIQRRRGK